MQALTETAVVRWAVSAAVAVILVAAVLGLFRVPEISEPYQATVPRPTILLLASGGSNAAFDEKTMLMDPTPLFLPTKWNVAQKPVTGPAPGGAFSDYSPTFSAASVGKELKINFPPPVEVPATPVDALEESPAPPLQGFGRADVSPPALAPRVAFMEIVAEKSGQRVLQKALSDTKPPGEGAWEPLEFLVGVDAFGAVGAPVPVHLSGIAEVDNYFQRYLAQTLRAGSRLAPGFYRVSIGP
jgi:hypothetical protein